MTMNELALFDLDHTLLDTDSDYLWGEYLVKKRLVDENEFRQKNQEFYQQYLAGTLDAVAYNEFVAGFLKQNSLEQLHTWRADYIANDIAPKVRPKAVEAINAHLAKGHDIVIISATNAFLVKIIAEQLFNIKSENVLATDLEINETGYTGKLAGRPNFQDGKVFNLQNWLAKQAQQGVTYTRTYAYSDSKNDIPLLEWADVAVAVSPDDALHAYALAHHWAVEDWSI